MLRALLNKLTSLDKTTDRCWIEINIENLKYNVKQLSNQMHPSCAIMAVIPPGVSEVGNQIVAKELYKLGIRSFAVDNIEDAVALRKHKIRGEILVLGETCEPDFAKLSKYQLIQSVSNLSYAKLLADLKSNISVHVHLSPEYLSSIRCLDDLEEIKHIYYLPHIKVTGTYSYLTDEKSKELEDVVLTELEIEQFFNVINMLKNQEIIVGKTHLQGSYGILNYSHIRCEYARIDAAFYGICQNESIKAKPVVSVKSKVIVTKALQEGEFFSYGSSFVAPRQMNVAVISIGSADGIPKNLSINDGHILLHENKVPIIGQICMNQLVVDVTEVDNVQIGDVVTVIGSEGQRNILVEEFALDTGYIVEDIIHRFLKLFQQSIVSTK